MLDIRAVLWLEQYLKVGKGTNTLLVHLGAFPSRCASWRQENACIVWEVNSCYSSYSPSKHLINVFFS